MITKVDLFENDKVAIFYAKRILINISLWNSYHLSSIIKHVKNISHEH